jgi:hypothetical protein
MVGAINSYRVLAVGKNMEVGVEQSNLAEERHKASNKEINSYQNRNLLVEQEVVQK